MTAEPRSSARTSSASKPSRPISRRSTGDPGCPASARTEIEATAHARTKSVIDRPGRRPTSGSRDEPLTRDMAKRAVPAAYRQAEPDASTF